MNADEILSRIRQTLDLPGSGQVMEAAGNTDEAPVRSGRREELAQLASGIEQLRRETQQVGCVPQGYPRVLNLVMKTIHRLLPWYTRPIRAHAECTVAVAEMSLRALSAIVQEQQQIAAALERIQNEVRELRTEVTPPDRP